MAIDDPGAPFKYVGGHLSLDFINTVSGRLPNPSTRRDYVDAIEKERLVDFADLTRWGRGAGILSPTDADTLARAARAAPAKAAQVVARARRLRDALYRVFVALHHRWTPEPPDLAVLNRELERARAHERLTADGRRIGWEWNTGSADLERILWPAVRAAADLLTSAQVARVRRCSGDDCHWLFLDTSRNRSRRWCDMAECGNRAKVRRFRRRH